MRLPNSRLVAAAAAGTLVAGLAAAAVAVPSWGHDAVALRDARVTPATRLPTGAGSRPPAPAATQQPSQPSQHPAGPPRASAPLYPLPAKAVQPEPCPVPPRPPGKPPAPPPPPKVAEAKVPAPLPLAKRTVDLAPVRGKGMWLTTWPDSHLDVAAVVRQARGAGLSQLWVRTGGTRQGYYGDGFLRALLPAAHRAGLQVVAWDFPFMGDPRADAERARRALSFTVHGQRIDAFSPDIETKAEGTYATARRMRYYLSLVRRYAGNRPVVSTVPRPTSYRLRTYPYAAQQPYVDAFAPMVYWSCNEPGALVDQSLARLGRLRPVHVVGQAYDMGDEGGRPGLPSGRETWRFLDRAKRDGAIGASLWTYEEAGPGQWRPLAAYPWP